MTAKVIDIYHRLLKYNDHEIRIAFDNEQNLYFNSNQIAKILGYKDPKDALRKHVLKKDIVYLKDIVSNYKILYKNAQGQSKYLSEAGFNHLILKSRKKIAVEIADWIAREVMPSIRKYGVYRSEKSNIDKIQQLQDELDAAFATIKKKSDEIDVLKHNMKIPKYETGYSIYIMRRIEKSVKFDPDEILELKVGKTDDPNKRKKTYDTGFSNRSQYLKVIKVTNKNAIEECIKAKMTAYTTIPTKEYYKCSYNTMIDVVAECVKFFDNTDIDKTPDVSTESEQARMKSMPPFDPAKVVTVIFSDDMESDSESESDSDDDLSDDDVMKGGGDDLNYRRYLKYKIKLLTLMDEML